MHLLTRFHELRWSALAVTFFISFNIGAVVGFSAWQNEIKDIFILSQTQVEILGSVLVLGHASGVIGGLLLEQCGIRVSGCVALSTVVSYATLYTALHYPERGFNAELFPVLVLLFALNGIGSTITYVTSLTVCLQNYTALYGGRIQMVIAIAANLSLSFASTGVLDVFGLMILFGSLQLISSVCCIFLLRRIPETHQSQYVSLDEAKTQERDGEGKETELKSDSHDTKESASGRTEPANEKTALKSRNTSANQKVTGKASDLYSGNDKTQTVTGPPIAESIYGDVYGFEIIKLMDFWLLLVTFLIGSSIDKTFVTNLGTYLRAFRHEQHLHIIMSTGPWIAMVTKSVAGVTSDLYIEKIPRLLFLVVLLVVKFPLIMVFIIYGDNIVLTYILTYFLFISFGISFVIGPVLVAEYFGVVYYGRNFGSVILAEGFAALLLQFLIGVLYDAQVTDSETNTCYGLKCFYVSSGIMCGLSLITLSTSIILYVRRRNVKT